MTINRSYASVIRTKTKTELEPEAATTPRNRQVDTGQELANDSKVQESIIAND